MPKLRQFCLLACLVVLSLLSTACGSTKMSGLKGRVIDPAGNGLAGIVVLLPDAGITVTTAADGTYQIAPLAPRTYVLLVTHDNYVPASIQAADLSALSSTHNAVVVEKGKITTVADIVMKKQTNELDSATFTSVSPGPQLTVTAGANQNYVFQANYQLNSVDTATLAVIVNFECAYQSFSFFAATKAISKGENTVSFNLQNTIPHGLSLRYIIAIYDDNHNLLAYNTTAGSIITGAKQPKAPTVTTLATNAGNKISWAVEYINFEYIKLIAGRQVLIYEREEDDPGEYLDTNLLDGQRQSYEVCYKAINYTSELCSGYVAVTKPVRGFSTIPIGKQLADIAYDSQRNLIYTIDSYNDNLLIISPENGLIDTIAIGGYSVAFSISTDYSWLFTCNASGSFTAINLTTKQKQLITTPHNYLYAIMPHTDGSVIYLIAYKNSQYVVQTYDWRNQTVLHEATIKRPQSAKSIAISPDGSYLYIGCSSTIYVLNTSDLSTAHTYSHMGSKIIVNPNPTIPEIYADARILKSSSPWLQLDRLPEPISAVSNDGSQLYSISDNIYSINDNILKIYRASNYSYVPVDSLILPTTKLCPVAGDKLYFLIKTPSDTTYNYDIGVLDLTVRQQ